MIERALRAQDESAIIKTKRMLVQTEQQTTGWR